MSPGRVSDAVMEASKTSAAVSSLAAFYPLPSPTLIPTPPPQAERHTGRHLADKEGTEEVKLRRQINN